ncbi:tRNA:m(4)X modification enzyme TRM13 homolog [Strongylocentrotus purpuratus]|uniref:tRNA:m(4)X modification enzyme TRM13 n=1 Tax=Strongylocentrotus purpuratus TaxID=7668 RepID=A0A7M7PJ22_STRPU|nr:tRNA:m(4)X modification enzyme TRM13 homolog [Strongylocentrotus purpuratus]
MEEERQCNFFVKKRKRLCRLLPGKGKKFCGEHINLEKGCNANQNEVDQSNTTGRIPCPYDPNHTVAVKQLAKHFKVCNSRPKEQPIYYEKGINAGSTEYDKDLEMLRLASFSLEEIQLIISKVESAYAEHVHDVKTEILHHDALKAEVENPENGVTARKHLLQLDSLLGHMNRLDLLQPDTCFVEFGAGRGRLSQWIQQAMGNLEQTSFLLVDRAAVRHKRDTFYQRDDGGYERISMDIENLILGKVPNVCNHGNRPVVAYTKHLCGAATDLALRCLMETRTGNIPQASSETLITMNKPGDEDNSQCPEHSTQQSSSQRSSSSTPQSFSGGSPDSQHISSDNGPTDVQSTIRQGSSPSEPRHHEGIPGDNSSAHQQVVETDDASRSIEPTPVSTTIPVKGVVMALCCHHRCSWRTHVGKQFFQDVGISERDFMALVRMSSWATCGTRLAKDGDKDENKKEEKGKEDGKDGKKMEGLTDDQLEGGMKETQKGSGTEELMERSKKGKERVEGENSDIPEEQASVVGSLGLSVPEREEIGFKCKRILDMGRIIYLRNLGLDAKLVSYVERNISPENVVLIAKPLNQ